ncbi:MAG: hypothetical protein R3C56_15300 [Pirellulaceae bacterium]
MARPNRSEVFSPDEPSIVHVISRVVRRCSIGPLITVAGKRGVTPSGHAPILQRLGLEPDVWCELVHDFGTLFSLVAGRLAAIDEARTLGRQARFHTRPRTRELLSV